MYFFVFARFLWENVKRAQLNNWFAVAAGPPRGSCGLALTLNVTHQPHLSFAASVAVELILLLDSQLDAPTVADVL